MNDNQTMNQIEASAFRLRKQGEEKASIKIHKCELCGCGEYTHLRSQNSLFNGNDEYPTWVKCNDCGDMALHADYWHREKIKEKIVDDYRAGKKLSDSEQKKLSYEEQIKQNREFNAFAEIYFELWRKATYNGKDTMFQNWRDK